MSDQHAQAAQGHAVDHAEHPTWRQYKWVALWLTLITVVEVWVYYTPFREHSLFAPVLLLMSAVKFTIVVLFYMHLKYDHWIFRRLFTGSLALAACILTVLMFLFHKLSI